MATGLDKEATKQVFRKLGLPTPPGYVVRPGDFSPIYSYPSWDGPAIVKPLRQGNSEGMDEQAVVDPGNHELVRQRAERIHEQFGEPALVERYVGGNGARELTVPMLISHDAAVAELPLIEIDLAQVPAAQGEFSFLTHEIKDETYYLKIPAELPRHEAASLRRDAERIIAEIGCMDMTRIDLRGDSQGWYYIEVNVNPGKNRFSFLPASAYTVGLDYSQMVTLIPYQAMLRYGLQPPRALKQLVEPVMALFDGSAPLGIGQSG